VVGVNYLVRSAKIIVVNHEARPVEGSRRVLDVPETDEETAARNQGSSASAFQRDRGRKA
jgi:hypothetical protein